MSSSGFGQWYENQQAAESGGGGGTASASSSWLGSSATDMLPLFNTEAMPSVSFSSMKASMEAQMPMQIMGMGYQQRFKASGYCMTHNTKESFLSTVHSLEEHRNQAVAES
jgi:hypothetical protein